MRAFFPVSDPAQANYEALRAAALGGTALLSSVSARFERGGLAALISPPWVSSAPACFVAELVGAARPAWTPYDDPRLETLADSYGLIVRLSGATEGLLVTVAKEA